MTRTAWRRAGPLLGPVLLLACWPTHRHRTPADGYSYAGALRPLLRVVLCLLLVEAVVVEVVLVVTLGASGWTWLGLGLHVYALAWFGGRLAALPLCPHRVAADGLRVRDGIRTELVLPYAALTDVRTVRRAHTGRSGLHVDPATGTALLAHGDATVLLTLCPNAELLRDGEPYAAPFTELWITVDDPGGFRAAIRARCEEGIPPRSTPA